MRHRELVCTHCHDKDCPLPTPRTWLWLVNFYKCCTCASMLLSSMLANCLAWTCILHNMFLVCSVNEVQGNGVHCIRNIEGEA